MAQAAKVSSLISDLATSFATAVNDKDARKLKTSKDAATKIAKTHQYVRTNQFEVEATLSGLIEKFSIINRDDLADALNKRLDELRTRSRSKWTPEVLSLFLSLADRPDQKSSLEALELLRPPSPEPEPVTWEELEAEEPLRGDVWLDESYSSASEEEEVEVVEKVRGKLKTRDGASPIREDGFEPVVTDTLTTTIYKELEAAQFWTQTDLRSSRPQLLSELEVIREVLLMLRGLPTSLFAIDEKNMLIYHATNVMLTQISLSGLNDILQSFAGIGSDLFRLRKWTENPQEVTLLQAFNASVCKRVHEFDCKVASIEQGFVGPKSQSMVVSILQVHHDLEELSRPMTSLSALTTSVAASGGGFICLELLYSQLCSLQAAGDSTCFSILGEIFFECLNVYLRPVALWMEEGTILDNDESFFISVADKGSALSNLWHERYTLRTTNDGTLHVPSFLRPAAKKILNAGKSIVFLQHLRKDIPDPTPTPHSRLMFSSILDSDGGLPLIPFSELFTTTFNTWMDGKYGPASLILKQHLFSHCDLLQHISVLEHIYFSKDGVLFQSFADELFKRMGNSRGGWNDKFLLTELARRVFGGVEGIKPASLSVRASAEGIPRDKDGMRRGVQALTGVVVDINLPWPVQNIIPRSALSAYQAIFSLLLQIYYAKHLLRSCTFDLHHQPPSTPRTTRLAIGIRQQLTWFANTLHSYILETVVSSSIGKLGDDLVNAEDLDEMCEVHGGFVKKLELGCLLGGNLAPIRESMVGVLEMAGVFAETQGWSNGRPGKGKADPKSGMRRGRRKQRDGDSLEAEEDDSGVESEASAEEEDESSMQTHGSPQERLQAIHDKFSQLLHFAVAGLRSVSRAGGQAEWEMLAEKLEWGLQRRKRGTEYV